MNQVVSTPGELEQAYEALRAQATGQLPATTPRGLALFLAGGLPTWLAAWMTPALAPVAVRPAPPVAVPKPGLASVSTELVMVLTEMVLGGQRRYLT